jgi:hypothetical protein
MARDNRELTQKLIAKNTRPTGRGRQQDAKHQGAAKK